MKRSEYPTRRDILRAGAVVGFTVATSSPFGRGLSRAFGADPAPKSLDMQHGATDLIVQPVLMYAIPSKREGRSWRNWGSIQTEKAVQKEAGIINGELKHMSKSAGCKLTMLPLQKVASVKQVGALKETKADVIVVYAAGGWTTILNAIENLGKKMIIFIRRRKGAYYLWDEIVHSRFLRKHTDSVQQETVGLDDVAVDDAEEIQWRLRALYGLKNTAGRRIICVGGPGGWSSPKAPDLARERFQLDMVTVGIPEINAMVQAARKDDKLMARCMNQAKE